MNVVMKPKLVTLHVWAEVVFGENKPHGNTLRSWVNNGLIHPAPKKIGRGWYVKPDAEYKG